MIGLLGVRPKGPSKQCRVENKNGHVLNSLPRRCRLIGMEKAGIDQPKRLSLEVHTDSKQSKKLPRDARCKTSPSTDYLTRERWKLREKGGLCSCRSDYITLSIIVDSLHWFGYMIAITDASTWMTFWWHKINASLCSMAYWLQYKHAHVKHL